MEIKSIKIPAKVHKELKVFVAHNSEDNMIEFSGLAIMKELAHRGHKFVEKPKSKNEKR